MRTPFLTSTKKRHVLWFSFLCLLSVGLLFQSAEAATGIDTGIGSGPLEPTSSRNIVCDSSGYWYVVYRKSSEIWLARSADGSTWSKVKLLGDESSVYGIISDTSNQAHNFTQASIDINPARNTIHLVWMDDTDGEIYYSKCSNLANWNQSSGWTKADGGTTPRYEQISNAGSDYCYNPAVAVDWDNYPHVAWSQGAISAPTSIMYDTYQGSAWKATDVTADSNANGIDYPSIDIDINDTDLSGYVHIAYRVKFSATKEYYRIDYAKSDNTSTYESFTVTTQIIYTNVKDMRVPSLAVDHNDNIYVVCYDAKSQSSEVNFYDSTTPGWAYTNGTSFHTTKTTRQWNPVVGINWANTDHRLVQVHELTTRYVYKWQWNTTGKTFDSGTATTNDAQGADAGYNICIEKRKPETASDMGYVWWDSVAGKIYFDSITSVATAIDLISFTAMGDGNHVRVEWETAQEINNMGFYLFRARNPGGPFVRLNSKLIPGLSFSVMGKAYTYTDRDVTRGELYYYKLEDLDVYGTRTFHGPICVDWDADGLPDDWEIAYGLDPGFDDSRIDSDFDGLTNLEEYEHGTDPLNPDTDGDGILDGDETRTRDRNTTGRTLSKGVQILASDETGITLELRTDGFDMEIVEAQGQAFERLRILDYIHGYTTAVGVPELPMKGILIDLPEGTSATIAVEETNAQTYSGYWIYPVPENAMYEEGEMAHVGEVFTIDEAAYSTDLFYPAHGGIAQLGETYTFRDQQKLQVLFYPLVFNPKTRELKHYTRIRVRVTYEDTHETLLMSNSIMGAMAEPRGPSAAMWTPPSENPAYKIFLSDEGMYRLTRAYFTDNAIAVDGIDLSQVRLYSLIEEVPLYIYDQDGDHQFDTEDYIEFYGRPVDAQYAKYAKYNVYWLTTQGGSGTPKRMTAVDGTPGVAPIANTHSFTVHYEEDGYYWMGAPGGDSLDRWFFSSDYFVMGDGIDWPTAGDPVDFTLSLPGVSGQGILKIRMWGTYDTDHEMDVSVNGTPVGTYTWSGIAFYEAIIDPVNLLAGDNTVTLTCNSGIDLILVDWFEVTYSRDFMAVDDSLKFSHQSGYRYQVSGFGSDDLMAFDITTPGGVKQVLNGEVNGIGLYSLEFEPQDGAGERTYLVLSSGATKTPMDISEDETSNLSDGANGADYLLITHRDLGWDGNGDPNPWLNSLVGLREGQGLRVVVVDVADIFDEFSYGISTPQAIKDFLAYSYTNWTQPAPQYVLLVGDSTYDYKDNWGFGTINFVPTYLTVTEYMGETVTDEWFVRVSGDDAIPDLYIGRLPAASADEAAIMVNKIIGYETALNTKTWEKNILLVADNQRDGEEYDYEAAFETMNEDAAGLIPTAMNTPFKGYLGDYLAHGDLTIDITEKINEGTLILNYSGHGSVQIWAHENIFDNGDVTDLTNDGKFPFVISMSCLTGYFAYPEAWNFPSLSEALVRSEHKAGVATFMPTGMTATGGQHILDTALFDAIFTEDIRTLGPAISQAKQTLLANGSGYEEVSETFLLFGDPAMELKIPLPHRPTGVSVQGTSEGITITWDAATDCNGKPVSGYNIYRSTTPGGTYTKMNTSLITGTEYTDTSAESGTTYYYVVTSVDGDGDQSVQSSQMSAMIGSGMESGTALVTGCFISTAGGGIW